MADFRSIRKKLPPEVFQSGGEDVPPSDLVSKEVWDGIMHLPDDVALRISDHYGSDLAILYAYWGDWLKAIGEPGNEDMLYYGMLDAADCFQCCTFDLLHGYYRAAISNLRAALELVLITAYGRINPCDKFYEWQEGKRELRYTDTRRELAKLLKGNSGAWILLDDQRISTLYARLCRFTHSRLESSDGALWESNGPVAKNEAVVLSVELALETYRACYIIAKLARPTFRLPGTSDMLFTFVGIQESPELVKAWKELGEF